METPTHPFSWVIVHNISKKANWGTLLRSASAFGVHAVIIAGPSKKMRTFGALGADKRIKYIHVPDIQTARQYVLEKGGKVCGIEIVDGAKAVETHPFDGPTAFLPGCEGSGLTELEKSQCDFFVYIRQYGQGTASCNVVVATSIILHHFALWSGMQERTREGEKFVVGHDFARIEKYGDFSKQDAREAAMGAMSSLFGEAELEADEGEGEGEAGEIGEEGDL